MDQSSDSGFINKPFVSGGTDEFADYVEMPCGGFNRLFRAKRYGKWFVLKGLKPEFSSNPIYRNLLDKEFELGMMLSHPNIVTFYGREFDATIGDCIIMECVDGVTLADFLETKPSYGVVMKVIGEILSAMSYFHGLQVIHRDIKPSNILVTRNGNNVKIIDFGFSDTDSHVILKQPAGTARYAAPEQYDENVAIDCRADIYSFGMVLKDIVSATGFRGCSAVVRKCTQTDREKRYSNALDVLSAIRMRRRLMVVLPIVVALLLLLGFGAAIAYSHFEDTLSGNVHVPAIDTVVVAHVDTVVRVETEENDDKEPAQTVIVRSQSDTEYEQAKLDEAKVRIGTLYRSYRSDFEKFDGYREFLVLKINLFFRETIVLRDEIGADIPNEDAFKSHFVNYCNVLMNKYHDTLHNIANHRPSFAKQYQDSIITIDEYQDVAEKYKEEVFKVFPQ
ncbi:MAG: serine/threonine protein kinase [Bacteroidales bacterium]|nr:serine/threonine protein kinase [Bacteroidales bacterium]